MMKYSKIILPVILVAMGITGCSSGKNETVAGHTSVNTTSDMIEATERTKGWFEDAANAYVKETFGDTDFKLYSRVYNVRTGVSESNVLQYVSADMCLYFDSADVQTQETADFSDNFARKFASDGASGDIKFSVYTVPEDIYAQIGENNYMQVEEKAKSLEGYTKLGFSYAGIGDAVYSIRDPESDYRNVESETQDGLGNDGVSGNGSTEFDAGNAETETSPETEGDSESENDGTETNGTDIVDEGNN